MSIDFLTFLGIALIIALVAGFTYYYAKRGAGTANKDPLVYKEPNKTNYNISQMDNSDLDDLSKEEAKEILRKREQSSNDNALSRDDYAQIKRAIDK